MAKELQVNYNVDSSSVDKAIQKTGQLKELSKGLSIQYDIDGKPIDIVIDKSLNLQKQVKILTAELRRTKEGTEEFALLSSRLNDAKDNLERVNAKSRDLFASLSLLPGPVGQFFNVLNGSIGTLKLFSGFKFSDLKNQFKELNNDLTDIVQNLFGVTGAANEAKAELADTASTVANTGAEAANTEATTANVIAQDASAKAKLKDSAATQIDTAALLQNNIAELDNSILIAKNVQLKIRREVASLAHSAALGNETVALQLKNAQESLNAINEEISLQVKNRKTLATQLATLETNKNTVATEANTVATTTATTASRGFGGALKSILTSTTFWIAAIAAATYALYKWLESYAQLSREQKMQKDLNEKQVKDYGELIVLLNTLNQRVREGGLTQRQKTEAVNEYNKKLGDTLGTVKSYSELEKKLIENGPVYVKYLQLKAKAESAYQLSVERGKQVLETQLKNSVEYASAFDIWSEGGFLGFIYDTSNKAGQQKKQKFIKDLEKDQQDFLQIFNTTNKELEKLAEQLKIPQPKIEGTKDGKATDPNDARRKRLKELEALIKEEIDKEKTSRDELEKFLTEKAGIIQIIEKSSAAEMLQIKKENSKVIQNALKEDAVREAEIMMDAADRKVSEREREFGKDEEYYKLRRDAINAEYKKDIADADDDANKKLNAKEKQNQSLYELDKEYFDSLVAMQQRYVDVEKEGTAAFYQEQRNLENMQYEEKKKQAQNNNAELELIEREHKKRMGEIDQDESLSNLEKELGILQTRNESIQKGISVLTGYRKARLEELNKQEELELQKAEDNEKLKTEIKKKYTAQRKQLNKEEFDSYLQYASLALSAANQFVSDISEINQLQQQIDIQNAKENIKDQEKFKEEEDKIKEKYFYKNQKTQVAQAIIGTMQAAIQAYQSLAVIPKVGPILGGIAAAAALAFGFKKVDLIKKQKYQSSLEESGGGAPTTVRGMADGGYIDGPRHAQGGVMINAEGGEAVMTRGAVTMFGPLLSALNQMGGGTSFTSDAKSIALPDNPVRRNIAMETNAQIIKTYVVESELTTEQQRQARLKDLSTL